MDVADDYVLAAVQCITTKTGNIGERAEGIKGIEAILLAERIPRKEIVVLGDAMVDSSGVLIEVIGFAGAGSVKAGGGAHRRIRIRVEVEQRLADFVELPRRDYIVLEWCADALGINRAGIVNHGVRKQC